MSEVLWIVQSLCRSGKGIFISPARLQDADRKRFTAYSPTFSLLAAFVAVAALAIGVLGCVANPAVPAPVNTISPTLPSQGAASSTAAARVFPQTVTDALDRQVSIDSRPQRIVSLAPSVTEILFAIGAESQLVGRTRFDNYPPEAEKLPDIGGYSAKTISVEAIVNLKPDLVIAGTKSQKEIVEALERVNIPVFTVAPTTIAEIQAGILAIGAITGNAERAQAVVADMQQRIAEVTAKTGAIPPDQRVRVFYHVFDEPLTTASNSTFIGEVLKLAGGENIFGELTDQYPKVSVEEVVARNPQVIVGPNSNSIPLSVENIRARPGWAKISAVENGAIYIVDGNMISRAGPRIVDALEGMAQELYPELFK